MSNNFIKPTFEPIEHKYSSSLGTYTSITGRIHNYEPEKDWNGIALAYLKKRNRTEILVDLCTKQKKTLEEVIEMIDGRELNVPTIQSIWKQYSAERCDYGSEVHAQKETNDLATKLHEVRKGVFLPIGIDPEPITDYFNDLPDGIYVELRLWDNTTLTSGTADKIIIETIDGIRYVEVLDYKTNKQIIDYNYIDKKGNKITNEYMLAPFNKRCNSNYWHYQIQLNCYGYMSSLMGFKLRGGKIIHTQDNDKEYKLLNLQAEVKQAFDSWKIVA